MGPLTAELRDRLLLSLQGEERARCLAIAGICVLVYDMALTFADEVEYFWKGPWTLSRVLFFVNRYFPFVVLAVVATGLFAPDLSPNTCAGFIHGGFVLVIIGVAVVQAIIVLRICYVYSKNQIVRIFLLSSFVVTTVATCAIYFVLIWPDVDPRQLGLPPGVVLRGCKAPPSGNMWKLFIPNLVYHTILYLTTTIPALRMRRIGKKSRLMDRLVVDGGLFYFIVFAATMFSTIGSITTSPIINLPAIYSNIFLSLAALAVSRLMLSVRSLAARLSLAPDWLLSNAELARVNWKPGRNNGELIVEVNAVEEDDDLEMKHVDDAAPARLRTTRVGVLEHAVYPGTRDYKTPRKPSRAGRRSVALRPGSEDTTTTRAGSHDLPTHRVTLSIDAHIVR